MLGPLYRAAVRLFEWRYGYDAAYLREMAAVSPRAFRRFARSTMLSQHREAAPKDLYFAAKILGAMYEDCGPCTQLAVRMAEEARVPGATLRAVVAGDDAALPEPVLLGVRFARAVLAHDPEADTHRAEIARRWGPKAVIDLSFALAFGRVFPCLKYGMGHGRACLRVEVKGLPPVAARAA